MSTSSPVYYEDFVDTSRNETGRNRTEIAHIHSDMIQLKSDLTERKHRGLNSLR